MPQKTKKHSASSAALASQTVATTTQLANDVKHSLLIVSLVVNLFIFTTWITLQVTTQFDSQLSTFLFSR